MERINTYPIDHVFRLLYSSTDKRIIIDGCSVKRTSQRYSLFRKSTVCVKCGLKATHFALERHNPEIDLTYHFNLYAKTDDGDILFTKDHILPKSKGGKNAMSNYQVMCTKCNGDKGNKIDTVETLKNGINEKQIL